MAKKPKKKHPGGRKPSTNGRNKNGQFAKGNCVATGRAPDKTHKFKLTEAFKNSVTEADIIDIAKKLVKKAKAGDYQAAKDVLDRCLGRPKETHEIGGIGGQRRLIVELVTSTAGRTDGQD